MISQEKKDQIEKDALVEFPERLIGTHTGSVYDQNEHDRAIWKEGATKYAEKLEEKDKEIKALRDVVIRGNETVDRLCKMDESKDREIERLKYDLDSSVKALIETCKKQNHELAQLKEKLSKLKNEKI